MRHHKSGIVYTCTNRIYSTKKYFYVSLGNNFFTVFLWWPLSCGGPGQLQVCSLQGTAISSIHGNVVSLTSILNRGQHSNPAAVSTHRPEPQWCRTEQECRLGWQCRQDRLAHDCSRQLLTDLAKTMPHTLPSSNCFNTGATQFYKLSPVMTY